MQIMRVEGRFKALSPVYHGGNEKTGSVVLLNRLKFIVDGEPVDVPIISGNALRGRLRRLIMQDLCRQVGWDFNFENKRHMKLYHTLFAGGVLSEVEEEAESGRIDLAMKAALLKIPPIALFGLSYSNQIIEGRLKVGHLLPICRELQDYTGVKSKVSFYQLIGRAFQTRRDELRITPPEPEPEKNEAVQMLIEYEVFSAGTEFYHEMIVENSSSLLLSCLARAIELFKADPFLGGKSSVGFGKLQVNYSLDAASDQYMQYIAENMEQIYNMLDALTAML